MNKNIFFTETGIPQDTLTNNQQQNVSEKATNTVVPKANLQKKKTFASVKKQSTKKIIKNTELIDPFTNREQFVSTGNSGELKASLSDKSSFDYIKNELHEGYQNVIEPYVEREVFYAPDSLKFEGNVVNNTPKTTDNESIASFFTLQETRQGREYSASIFSSSYEWLIGILLVSLIIVAWVKQFYNKYLVGNINAGFDYKVAYKLYIDNNNLSQRVSVALFATFIINSGIFIYQMLKMYQVDFSNVHGFMSLFVFSGIIFMLYLLKRFAVTTIGAVSRQTEITKEYLHHIAVYNKILGLVLFPIVFSIPFIQFEIALILVKLTWFLWFFFYMMKIIRGIRIIMYKHFSVFYLILYFCTLEILPLLIVYKVFISLI